MAHMSGGGRYSRIVWGTQERNDWGTSGETRAHVRVRHKKDWDKVWNNYWGSRHMGVEGDEHLWLVGHQGSTLVRCGWKEGLLISLSQLLSTGHLVDLTQAATTYPRLLAKENLNLKTFRNFPRAPDFRKNQPSLKMTDRTGLTFWTWIWSLKPHPVTSFVHLPQVDINSSAWVAQVIILPRTSRGQLRWGIHGSCHI